MTRGDQAGSTAGPGSGPVTALWAYQPPAITNGTDATATTGTTLSFQVTTAGFPKPKLTLTGTLPQGIHFDTSPGTLSGTAKTGTTGTYQLTFRPSHSP